MKNICTVQVDLFYSFVISNGVMKAKINISLKGWKLLFLKMTEGCHFAFANNEWSLMCMVVVPFLLRGEDGSRHYPLFLFCDQILLLEDLKVSGLCRKNLELRLKLLEENLIPFKLKICFVSLVIF